MNMNRRNRKNKNSPVVGIAIGEEKSTVTYLSPLVRKGIRRRGIEDIPPIEPRVIQYRIERMYCRKTYEPEVPNALPGARLSLGTMLIVSYMKIGMRMSIENVSPTMKEMFGITITEDDVQEILYQPSDFLGKEYLNLVYSTMLISSFLSS